MIRLENVCKNFGDLQVLKNVNLEVKKGEFLSIMGPSGCGKSTLLNIIGLLDNPSSGTIEINGIPTEKMKDKQFMKKFADEMVKVVNGFHDVLKEEKII